MTKFKLNDIVKPNETYYKAGKKAFGNTWKGKEFQLPIVDIYEKEGYEPVYMFNQYDSSGNQLGFAEKYLELAQ